MTDSPPKYQAEAFNENYFKSGTYEKVSYQRFSQYWFSNRYYAGLARRFGPPAGKVLEVGCGLGHLLGFLPLQYEIYGTDVNAWALDEARRNVPAGQFALMPAEDLSQYPASMFQIIITKHVVEHLADPPAAIAEMGRVLSPGGLLIFATPNLSSPMRRWKGERWIGYRDKTHISLKQPQEWLNCLRSNSITPQRIFSDGFWDAPYLPLIPQFIQKLIFGAPGGLQALTGGTFLPLYLGESLIVIARKVT